MTAEERLAELDGRFVEIYEAARGRMLDVQKAHALLLVNEDHMVLYHGDGTPTVITGLRPPVYDKLKTLNHVSLAILCLLTGLPDGGGAISRPVLDELRAYREQLSAARQDLDTTKEVEAGVLPRRLGILERCLAFLDQVIGAGHVSTADLAAFCRANVPDLSDSFAAAARAQLDACHAGMMRLKHNVLSAEDWASLRVVLMGPHMAREGNNLLQYFSRLLHTPMDACKRLVYFEGEDEKGALDLMGTTILDFEAARVVFDDEARLHRDILADATTRYLNELLPDEPGTSAEAGR